MNFFVCFPTGDWQYYSTEYGTFLMVAKMQSLLWTHKPEKPSFKSLLLTCTPLMICCFHFQLWKTIWTCCFNIYIIDPLLLVYERRLDSICSAKFWLHVPKLLKGLFFLSSSRHWNQLRQGWRCFMNSKSVNLRRQHKYIDLNMMFCIWCSKGKILWNFGSIRNYVFSQERFCHLCRTGSREIRICPHNLFIFFSFFRLLFFVPNGGWN